MKPVMTDDEIDAHTIQLRDARFKRYAQERLLNAASEFVFHLGIAPDIGPVEEEARQELIAAIREVREASRR